MRKRRITATGIVVVVGTATAALMLLMLVSCAGMSPYQKQLNTLQTFNSIYEQYLDEYDRQPASVQTEWKQKIDPLWAEASDAMNSYLLVSDPTSTDAERKLVLYSSARDQALRLLFTYGVEIKE